MASHLHALTFDANDPPRLARFWAALLQREVVDDDPRDGLTLLPDDDTGFRIRFCASEQPKTAQNRSHFDLTSTSLDDQRQRVARATALGARHADVGQRGDEGHVVLADPEGNEFCVIEPGNAFLDGCGVIGALAGDGTAAVGHFWSKALGWPLVWDQDEETAVQSPRGGPKITWGGPPLMPRAGRDRLRFDLAPPVDGDLRAEIDRLVSLGAVRLGNEPGRPGEYGRVAMTDPDGNEFSVARLR